MSKQNLKDRFLDSSGDAYEAIELLLDAIPVANLRKLVKKLEDLGRYNEERQRAEFRTRPRLPTETI